MENIEISGNNATKGVGSENGYGGGLYCAGSATITMKGLVKIFGNQAAASSHKGYGGGLALLDSNLILESASTMETYGNTASEANTGWGGGMYVFGASSITNNGQIKVNGNFASQHNSGNGGGLYVSNCNNDLKVLSGLTVSGNTASVDDIGYGGGICFVSSSNIEFDGSLRITENIASKNKNGYGGGVYINGSRPNFIGTELVRVAIERNKASLTNNSGIVSTGGGVYIIGNSNPVFTYCTIDNNIAADISGAGSAGGIMLDGAANINLSNSKISNNTASCNGEGIGGGILIWKSNTTSITFGVNNFIESNYASKSVNTHGYGGGIAVKGLQSRLDITGVSILGNTAGLNYIGYGGGVYFEDGGFTISSGDIAGNVGSPLGGTFSWGSGIYAKKNFIMTDSAKIDFSNDVYLFGDNTGVQVSIILDTVLTTPSNVARITPYKFDAGRTVLLGSNVIDNYSKFSLSDSNWKINEIGQLQPAP